MANITLRNSTGLSELLSANSVISTLPLSNIQLDNNFNNLNNAVNTKIGWVGTEVINGTITFASNTKLSVPNTISQSYSFPEKYAFLQDTPNDITSSFVYDVKKDSDGGAWTERCSNASWYNEELSNKWLGLLASETVARNMGGTTSDYYQSTVNGKFYRLSAGSGVTETFRGNKREFPKLALIVSESESVIIYDLTESNHPMWMKFPLSGVLSNSGYLYRSEYNVDQFVEAAEGRIYTGGTLGLCEIRLVYDDILVRNGTNTRKQEYISTRSSNTVTYYSNTKINQSGSDTFVYSVSVVSPKNGIIDDYGMTVPFVGIGASYPNILYPNEVIKYGTSPNTFTPGVVLRDDLFVATSKTDNGFWYLQNPLSIATNTFSMTYKSSSNPPDWSSETTGKVVKGDNVLIKSSRNTSIAFVDMLIHNGNTVSKGIAAKISNTYNTGWMTGDIRRCYLSNSTTEDRSYKRSTANVTGTITANTVSTGTELIGYSGFSANNYIREPYSADLDFGTGEWSVSSWINVDANNTNSGTIINRSFATGSSINLGIYANNRIVASASDGANTRIVTTTTTANTTTWIKVGTNYVANGDLSIMVNGTKVANTAGSPLSSANNANAVFTIGNSYALDAPFPGSIALVKVSGTVPTAEQSLFMYEQEKHMFTSNSKCLFPENTTITDLSYNTDLNVWTASQDTKSSVWSGLIRTKTFDLGESGNNDSTIIVSEATNILPDLSSQVNSIKSNKDIVVFDYQGTSNQVNFSLPTGYTKSSVVKGGRRVREGTTKDYTTSFDGFIETVQFNVAPNTWVQIQATKR